MQASNDIRYSPYSHKFKITKKGLFCGLIILIALLSNQTANVFPELGQSAYYVLLISRYAGTVCLYYATSKSGKLPKVEVERLKKLLVPIFVFYIVVDIIALFTSPIPKTYGIRYWTRTLSAYIDRFMAYLLAISIWKYRGKQSIKCLTIAMIADQIIVLIAVLLKHGVNGVFESFVSAFLFKGQNANYFEVHELTFCIGLLVIYYLFFSAERKKQKKLIVLLILLFILGAKRIGFAGILAAGLFSWFVKKKGLSKRMITTIGLCGIGVCFLFLALIYNDGFIQLLTNRGINDMGRGLIYGYFTRRSSFSPSYLGLGVAATSKMVENMDRAEVLYMQAVRGVHSNILDSYINYGFIGTIFWRTYNLVYLPRKFFKYYGKKVATLFISLLIYAYITYLTDNTEGYFMFQTTLLLLPISEYFLERNRLYSNSKLMEERNA